MTKTKSQLRAEAVERLEEAKDWGSYDLSNALLGEHGEMYYDEEIDAVIDLLTDEKPCTEKYGDEPNEEEKPSSRVDGATDHVPSEVRVGTSRSELPISDAVGQIREIVTEMQSPTTKRVYDSSGCYMDGKHVDRWLTEIADMVERDYVPRDAYDNCYRERDNALTKLSEVSSKLGHVMAERDKLLDKAVTLKRTVESLNMSLQETSDAYDEVVADRDRLQDKCRNQSKQLSELQDFIRDSDELAGRNKLKKQLRKVEAERDEAKEDAERWRLQFNQADEENIRLRKERDMLEAIMNEEHQKFRDEMHSRSCDEALADRDEWKAKAEQAMESYQDAKDGRDYWQKRASELDAELDEQFARLTNDMKPMTDENMAEDGWVRLPVDADSVPIHVGDLLEHGAGHKLRVCYLRLSGGWMLGDEDDSLWPTDTMSYRHYREPTLEDVLRDYGMDGDGVAEECADRIRELMGVE